LRGSGKSGVVGVGRLTMQYWEDDFDEIDVESILKPSEYVRELLEDFEVIGAKPAYIALISRNEHLGQLRDNVRAAALASSLGLKSIDNTKRKYCETYALNEEDKVPHIHHLYGDAYKCIKEYVWNMRYKLKTKGLSQPSLGVFGASLVLERLMYSFFCAHFLYRMGHRYEGHAVSRLILEQIAWAYEAHNLADIKDIAKIKTTQSITSLKRFYPEAGYLYGFLSKKTHIDYTNHFEFLSVENGKNAILHAQPEFEEYAQVLFTLGDAFGIVWELSQFDYIKQHEVIEINRDGAFIKSDRPFLTKMRKHLEIIREFVSKSSTQSEHGT
jgi:hypothetical protein